MPPAAPEKRIDFTAAFAFRFLAGSLLTAASCFLLTPQAGAQPKPQPQNGSPVPTVEQGIRWQALTSGQREVLRPLERDWSGVGANQKQKWLEIATRFPSLQPDEKSRIQARMTEWTQLTTEQRRDARVNYQQAKQVAPSDRRSQWEAYQSLPAEEKNKLAARAVPRSADVARKDEERLDLTGKTSLAAQPAKSNIVPNPAFSTPPRAVAPTVQQAQPGATTTLISKRPVPPAHQQTGLPKISAGPNFVDKSTLLPQRGPQGAATRSAAASAAEANQRR
jgi:Protein of unknown function (DUF3106)